MFKKKPKGESPELAAPESTPGAPAPAKKKKKLLIPILAGVTLLGALGAGGFLVATGRIKLPTAGGPAKTAKAEPAKKEQAGGKTQTAAKAPAPAAPSRPRTQARRPANPAPVRPPRAAAQTDPALGAKKIAKVWERIEAERLAEMVKDYRDPDLAQIVVRMDPRKAADLLSTLEPARAARVSQEMQRLASIVPPTEATS